LWVRHNSHYSFLKYYELQNKCSFILFPAKSIIIFSCKLILLDY
jgi:hypothetical protein